jgi:cell division septation protein DedD
VEPEPAAEAEPVPTEKTSVGGAFEPIRATPPEGALEPETPPEAPGREGLSDRYELRDEESIAIEEAAPPPKRALTGSRIIVGVLFVASLGIAALFWFGGDADTPPAPTPPSGKLAAGPPATRPQDESGPPAAAKPIVDEPGQQPPAAQTTTAEPTPAQSTAQPPPRTRSEAPPPVSATPITGKPAAPPVTASAVENPAAVGAGTWGVHVTSMLTEDGAQRELDLLKSAGYSAIARHVKVGAKGFWFRIYVGPFDTREDAQRVASAIKESGVRDYAMAQKIPGEGTGREDR